MRRPYSGDVWMNLSRRSLIGAGFVIVAAGLAGCSKAVQAALTTASEPTAQPAPTSGTPGSATATSGVAASTPTTSTTPTVGPSSTSVGPVSTTPTSPNGPAVEIAHGPRGKPL